VPSSFVQISSIMPQKRNPVPIEHLRHLASQTVGRARAVLAIMHNTPFTDMNDSEGETQSFGYEAFATAGRVLDLFTALVADIRIDPRRVAHNIRRSCITVTELADTLVRDEGLSFRQAHEIAAHVARAVVVLEGDLGTDGYTPFLDAFTAALDRHPGIDPARFAEIVSPEYFVAVRDRLGGPAPAAMDAAIAGYRAVYADFEQRGHHHAARDAAALGELEGRFNELLGAA
jgi:argininosuccinate lyase